MKEIQVQLRGPDDRRAQPAGAQIADLLRGTPGAVDVGFSTKGQKPEIEVELDRALAGTLGVTVGQVAQSLRPAFAGIDAGDWVDPAGETRDVTRAARRPRRGAASADLERLPLVVGRRRPDRVTDAARPGGARSRRGLGPAKIDHLDRDRVITVQANTEGRPLDRGDPRVSRAKLAAFPTSRRATRSRRAARRRTSRRCSRASSWRSAWRCC